MNARIIHLPASYLPEHVGGKEILVSNVIRYNPNFDHRVCIHHPTRKSYKYDGAEVDVLPRLPVTNYRYSYFTKIYPDPSVFASYLDQHKPDIVHFHDQGEGASLTHLRECKRRNIRALVTYHSPGQSCLQRALTFAGKEPCDGRIDYVRCTSCQYRLKSVPGWMSDVLARVRLPIDKTGKFNQRAKTELFYDSWSEYYSLFDRVQVYSTWLKNMLMMNGVPEQKIHYIELGGPEAVEPLPMQAGNGPLKLAFAGRPTSIKGIHLLISAVKKLPADAPVVVYFFGAGWEDSQYGRDQVNAIAGDPRFMKPEALAPKDVTNRLREMDVCVIPSLWPETGPLSVFDAFAAGVPIIGTNHAGIAERVRDGHNGLLFHWNSVDDLHVKIRLLMNDRIELQRLRENVVPLRTSREFAEDFGLLYNQMLTNA
jgi:glycosyltransferase involved in cell wall biosynthesis